MCLILGYLSFSIISSFILTDKPSDCPTLPVAYVPALVRVPDSVYPLSKLILQSNTTLPSIPTEINDPSLSVLSVRVSRLRSGGSATFILAKQKEILNSDFWCLFDDETITPVYIFHIKKSDDYLLFLECSLPDSIIRRVWYNRTIDKEIKIYLSTTSKILLQGFLNIPWAKWSEENEQSLTLCTRSSQIELTYYIQWIEFHRLVGISKFIIYNISNIHNQLDSIVNLYEEEYPGLIDIVQWNFPIDEIQYDCFLHYGDISEWIAVIDINEYLIPQLPYDTLPRLLNEQYGRYLQAIVIFESQEFCSNIQKSEIVIEQYISRSVPISNRSAKYFYRPRAIDYLAIHGDTIQKNSYNQMKTNIVLAQYPKIISDCLSHRLMTDTTIRDRFVEHLQNKIHIVFNK